MVAEVDTRMLKRDVVAVWKRGPMNRPVQVTPAGRKPAHWSRGVVTQRKFVLGRTLPEVERVLGLPAGSLAQGADVYELARLPAADEFELDARDAGAPRWKMNDCAFVPVRRVASIGAGKRLA